MHNLTRKAILCLRDLTRWVIVLLSIPGGNHVLATIRSRNSRYDLLGVAGMNENVLKLPRLSELDGADLDLLDAAVIASRNLATGFKEIAEALDNKERSRRAVINQIVRSARRKALECAESWAVFGALAEMQASIIRNEIKARGK